MSTMPGGESDAIGEGERSTTEINLQVSVAVFQVTPLQVSPPLVPVPAPVSTTVVAEENVRRGRLKQT